jgi:broad specificity phosphatase PhoE
MTFLFALLLAQVEPSAQLAATESTTIVLVRHAEKLNNESKDPGISAEGSRRADALAKYFTDKKVSTVIVSDTRRAEETGDLTAKDHGLKLTIVPIADGGEEHVKGVIAAIRDVPRGSTALVVGHSNTLAPVIEALGGPHVKPLCEKQFATMYVLEVFDGGKARLKTTSYGDSDPPGAEKCAE